MKGWESIWMIKGIRWRQSQVSVLAKLPTHCQAVALSCDWHVDYLDVKVKVPDQLFDDLQLLIVLGPKDSHIWLNNVEQLCHYLQTKVSA